MKTSYPIILTPAACGFTVYVPDLQINTEGETLTNAIEMARDAIGLYGVCKTEDLHGEIPAASEAIPPHEATEIVTFVDIDFDEYKRMNDMRTVRKNCTIPAWLEYQAEKAGINFSAVLQSALRQELGV